MLRRNDFACKRLEVFIVFHLPVMFPAAGASGRLLGFEFFPDEEGRLPEFDGRVKKMQDGEWIQIIRHASFQGKRAGGG